MHEGFGNPVSIIADGSYVIIGVAYEDGGDGDPKAHAGAVYVFQRTEGGWEEVTKLTASDAQAEDLFGDSVSISADGSTVIVGADHEDGGEGDPITNTGAAYVF